MCLATRSLPVDEDGAVVAIKDVADDYQCGSLVYLLLAVTRNKDTIKGELVVRLLALHNRVSGKRTSAVLYPLLSGLSAHQGSPQPRYHWP